MKRLQKAVRDYLTMRRGLGFKLAKHGTPALLGAAAKRLEKRWEGLNVGSR